MPGPAKTPTKLKVIRGTFRKDRAPKREADPEVVTEVPKPPTGMPRHGRRMWNRLAAELVAKDLLTVVDLEALEALCSAYALFKEARQAIYRYRDADGKWRHRTAGEYLAGRNSQTIPELGAMRQALALMKSYMVEFGLTPAARGKIELPAREPKDEDPMEKLWNEA